MSVFLLGYFLTGWFTVMLLKYCSEDGKIPRKYAYLVFMGWPLAYIYALGVVSGNALKSAPQKPLFKKEFWDERV